MQCSEFQQQLHAYLEESLEEPQRMLWRQHLSSCESCRELALREESTLIFSTAEPSPASPARIEECVTAVTALIRQDRLSRRLPARRRVQPWLAAAAAVMITIAGSVLWLQSNEESGAVPTAELSVPEPSPPESPPPEVEVDMDGEGIRVYHFATDDDANVAATFIVNPALEL
jgi:predicted anti-sigma-YlaC factor YlaD